MAAAGADQGAAAAGFNAPTLTQIPDGQVQNAGAASAASAASAADAGALNQIPDGQVQSTSAAGADQGANFNAATLNQIPDGQVQNAGSKSLSVTLKNGVLRDSQGRQGYIADNYQFQFDAPPQPTPYATSGFSVCEDGTLALNGSNVFYQCRSGNFSNLYDRAWAPQCEPVHLTIV
ncbi:hypothetical protein BDZ91DRAFT_698587 [Kalaharituber pfeilii]|nr:hypothetical protein BDZ91DRAFT_698587 [Kalaharituber pfeilii]